MQFASPASLFWLTLALPIVVFYILKIRLRRVPVSTVMFWNQIFDEKKPRSIWQRLRHLLSLLLQLIFLGLLALAVADPFFSWEMLRSRRIVLVVDNSASMNADDEKPSRLALARQHGHRLIRGLRVRDQMAIVSAGSTPHVQSGLTNHQRTLRETLDAVPATDGPTRALEAVQLAHRLLVGHENAKIVLLTDGCFADSEELSDDPEVSFVNVGTVADNTAITQFQVRRSLVDVVGFQILIEVSNFSSSEVECRLEVTLGDTIVDVVPLKLAPEEQWRRVLDHTAPAGGQLVATIDVRDALAVDNRAVALLPRRDPQPVTLVTEGDLFLQSALSAIPLVELNVVASLPSTTSANVISVLHDQSPEVVPPGNVMFIQPSGSNNLWTLGEQISDPLVAKQDSDSPLMTHVHLENVWMPAAREVEFQTEHHVLATSLGGQPLFTALEHAGGKTLVLNVELDKGDLPLRTAFPILMTNAIHWFRGDRVELKQAVVTGSVVECELEEESQPDEIAATRDDGTTVSPGGTILQPTTRLVLQPPDGPDRPLPNGVQQLTLGPLDRCGIWTVARVTSPGQEQAAPVDATTSGAQQEVVDAFACNLASVEESDLRVADKQQTETAIFASAWGGRPIWFYLVLLGLLLSAVEWFLYQRRWVS